MFVNYIYTLKVSSIYIIEKRELPSGQRWQTQDLLPKGFAGSNPASRIILPVTVKISESAVDTSKQTRVPLYIRSGFVQFYQMLLQCPWLKRKTALPHWLPIFS